VCSISSLLNALKYLKLYVTHVVSMQIQLGETICDTTLSEVGTTHCLNKLSFQNYTLGLTRTLWILEQTLIAS